MDLEKYKNGDSIKVTGICGNNIFLWRILPLEFTILKRMTILR